MRSHAPRLVTLNTEMTREQWFSYTWILWKEFQLFPIQFSSRGIYFRTNVPYLLCFCTIRMLFVSWNEFAYAYSKTYRKGVDRRYFDASIIKWTKHAVVCLQRCKCKRVMDCIPYSTSWIKSTLVFANDCECWNSTLAICHL